MQQRLIRPEWRTTLLLAGGAALLWLLRDVLRELAVQLAAAYLLMALALPLCRLLERRMKPGPAAALSFGLLGAAGALLLLFLIPPLAEQVRQLSESVPAIIAWVEEQAGRIRMFLTEHGVDLLPVRDRLTDQLQQAAGTMLAALAEAAGRMAQRLGKLFLAPLLAYYLLKDRRRISARLMLLFPVRDRARVVRAAREMRRETAGFLRGQLMLSGFVGALTGVGLLLVGTPGWLVLGLLMGVMELIPYIGPWIAGIPAVLLAMQGGLGKALWTVAVLVAVQQLEGGLISPRLLSGATRLHPLMVLLAISAGGMLAGTLGMLLALPVVVSVRGAVRGLRI